MSSTKNKILFITKVVLGIILLLLFIYPLFYVFVSSLKTTSDFQNLAPYCLPVRVTFSNYRKVIQQGNIFVYFRNSSIITFFTVTSLLFFASLAGFGLCKIHFMGASFLRKYFNLGLMIPMQVALIPLFYTFSKTRLLNTYPAVILPQIAFSLSYSTEIFYSFYKFLPDDVIESGVMDGCSPLCIFRKIVVPMSQNSFLTVATMQGVFCWNEFITTYTFTKSVSMKTVTLGLNDFVGMHGLTDWGATFAMIILTIMPTFIFYFLTNKYMLSGLTAGAIKE